MEKNADDFVEVKEKSISELSPEKQAILESQKQGALMKVASISAINQDPYPSPFLNLSDMQIPRTSSEIFVWCKYFYMFDPLIAGAINALATFPVTEVFLEDKNSDDDKQDSDTLKTYNRVIHKTLNIYKTMIEIGIDYFLFGNCIIFGEMYTNPKTGLKEWKSIMRLDPSKVIIDYNPATGSKKYKWIVPDKVKRIVQTKKPIDEYNKIPDIIKQAVKTKKAVILNSDNVYHFSRATDSMGTNGVWGVPTVANVLKLLMYRNVLRQAQEAIAREHIVPLRIFYLNPNDKFNPMIDWEKTATDFAGQLQRSVRDPNYKVVSPVPVDMVNLGGQGRALLLTPEIEQVQSEILAGMNVPREFIFGGVSYSGSTISLKILENQFITYRILIKDFIQNFLIKKMAQARNEWVEGDDDEELIQCKLQDLKMQDDVQQKQLIISLNSSAKVSDDYLWKTIGVDGQKMKEALEKEALEKVETQFKVQMRQLELNAQLQSKQAEMDMALQKKQLGLQQQYGMPNLNNGDPNGAATQGTDPNSAAPQGTDQTQSAPMPQQNIQTQQAQGTSDKPKEKATEGSDSEKGSNDNSIDKIALQLTKLNPAVRNQVLSKLPEAAKQAVVKRIAELESAQGGAKGTAVDMRPMPEQKPPRRDSLK